MKKITIIITLSIFLTASSFYYAQPKSNFTGTWKINKSKMDFGKAPDYIMPTTFVIDQQKDKIVVEKISVNQNNEEKKLKEQLLFNGSPFESGFPDGAKKVSIIKWNDDGMSFIWSAENKNAEGAVTSKISDTCTLDDGGKTLIIKRGVEQVGQFSYFIKGVYEKQ